MKIWSYQYSILLIEMLTDIVDELQATVRRHYCRDEGGAVTHSLCQGPQRPNPSWGQSSVQGTARLQSDVGAQTPLHF